MVISRSFLLACAAIAAALAAACQLKSSPVPPNYITVDPANFVLKSVERYSDPNGTETTSTIVVVKATYTNPEANPELVSPGKFILLDPSLQSVYFGLAGGDVNIPSMPQSTLPPGTAMDIAVGFRVPSSMMTARLAYHP